MMSSPGKGPRRRRWISFGYTDVAGMACKVRRDGLNGHRLSPPHEIAAGPAQETMAAPTDWITTTWQALPQFFRLVTRLKPTFHLPDVTALDRGFIEEHQVTALLWDVDGTLMPHHHMGVAAEFQATLKGLEGQVPQAILSNCGETRFVELGKIFPELPVLKAYRTEAGAIVLRSLQQGVERWTRGSGKESASVDRPSGQLRPLKKPSAELIEFALDRLGGIPRDRVLMIGDQYFTDIAGANLAGIRSVKVPTFGSRSFPFPIRTFQLIERGIYRLMNGKKQVASRN
jgi:predicted HAD superfamily phosphohydrolase YqeG